MTQNKEASIKHATSTVTVKAKQEKDKRTLFFYWTLFSTLRQERFFSQPKTLVTI